MPAKHSSAGRRMIARLSWYLDPLSSHQLKMFIKQEVNITKRSGFVHVKDWAILEPYVQTGESSLEFNPQCKIL